MAAAALAATGRAFGASASDEIERTIAETKFIDIHAHCTIDPMPPIDASGLKPLCNLPDLLAHYDRLGVEKGVVHNLCNPECFVGGMSNEEILEICSRAPDRLIPAVSLDPRQLGNRIVCDEFGEALSYYRDKGCRVCGEVCANLHFLDPKVQNLLRGCEEAGLPVTFHMSPALDYRYGLVDQEGLPELEVCLRRFPKLRFFGHSPAFWCEIAPYTTWDDRVGCPKGQVKKEGRLVELMRKYPNLYGDLSAESGWNALARDPDYAGRFLAEFQDRLMFGLDICAPEGWISPLADLLKDFLRAGRITPAIYRKVARENQIRELGLTA